MLSLASYRLSSSNPACGAVREGGKINKEIFLPGSTSDLAFFTCRRCLQADWSLLVLSSELAHPIFYMWWPR